MTIQCVLTVKYEYFSIALTQGLFCVNELDLVCRVYFVRANLKSLKENERNRVPILHIS